MASDGKLRGIGAGSSSSRLAGSNGFEPPNTSAGTRTDNLLHGNGRPPCRFRISPC